MADCGPVNPLQQLSKTFGRDTSLQQDRFAQANAGPSNAPFRSSSYQPAVPSDAQQFFNLSPRSDARAHPNHPPAWAGDFLRSNTPQRALSPRAAEKAAVRNDAAWVHDFKSSFKQSHTPQSQRSHAPSPVPFAPQNYHMPMHNYIPQQQPAFQQMQQATSSNHIQDSRWENAFSALDIQDRIEEHKVLSARPVSPSHDMSPQEERDALARTAGELLNSVSQDTNPKFQQSSFMDLMRKFRDKEAAVEGDKVVEQIQPVASSSTSHQQHQPSLRPVQNTTNLNTMHAPIRQGTAFDGNLSAYGEGLQEMSDMWDDEYSQREERKRSIYTRGFVGDGPVIETEEQFEAYMAKIDALERAGIDTNVLGASQQWEEDDFDNADLLNGPAPPTAEMMAHVNPQQAEWGGLQETWDAFEATATGIRECRTANQASRNLDTYDFHSENPYLSNSWTRNHSLHSAIPQDIGSSAYETLLQKEAAVQMDSSNPLAWLDLGIKQQENEREEYAIQALERALSLDDTLDQAWLALAVSLTNENDRFRAFQAINRWTACKPEYSSVSSQYEQQNGTLNEDDTLAAQHEWLIGKLIAMAISKPDPVDADVQVALGVLFNASEDYMKAADCFHAALSVRPNNPHLYNRLGATMANSGKVEDSIHYYFKALELQPDFARATFNLAAACINLSAYREAAEHLLRALSMQKAASAAFADFQSPISDKALEEAKQESMGTMSQSLWDSLSSCCHSLSRPDLAQMCQDRNLEAFRQEFAF